MNKQQMSKKIVYIAHPLSGFVEENIDDIKRILRLINKNSLHRTRIMYLDSCYNFANIIALAPYIANGLSEYIPGDREIGIAKNTEMIKANIFDEIWLTGEYVSEGMKQEVELFQSLGKPVLDYINKL